MGVAKIDTESEVAEQSFIFDHDGDSYIEIDLHASAWAADNRDADAEFEFRLSSPLSVSSHQISADMLFTEGRLLPLHYITSPAAGGGSHCQNEWFPTPGRGGREKRNWKEYFGDENSGTGDMWETRKPEGGWKVLSFRKSSSKVGVENDQSRSPMDKPGDLESFSERNRYSSALAIEKLPENTTGLEKLLLLLRQRVFRDVRGRRSSSFYHQPCGRDKRIRRAREIINKCWRMVNPFHGHKGRREYEASERGRRGLFAAGERSCRDDTGMRSCPTSLGSSPIHWRVNSLAYARELSTRDGGCSVQAAIAHCKKSISEDVVK